VSQQALARPARTASITLEGWDKDLAGALLVATAYPGPESEKRVAREYIRLKVPDRAAQHYSRAVLMDLKDGEAHEGLARIWRDGGRLGAALAAAHRAVYFAPRSAPPQNTLGTILLRLGLTTEALERFDRAVALDPGASYALNNTCYARLLGDDFKGAAEACEHALAITPEFAAARNNLAVAYASAGDFDRATRTLGSNADPAAAQFNLGVINMAGRRFEEAAVAFDEAARLRPGFALAVKRAAEAHRLAALALQEGAPDGPR